MHAGRIGWVTLQAAVAKTLACSFLMSCVLGLKFALKSQEERLYINQMAIVFVNMMSHPVPNSSQTTIEPKQYLSHDA